MESLARIGAWITANEALLSGIAALIVVAGVVFSPLGLGMRRLVGRSTSAGDEEPPHRERPTAAEEAASSRPEPSDTSVPMGRASIAVLPFTNMSDDSEQEFLADGMTEDIITGLSAMQQLHVVARNSTFAYKGSSPDIRQVGRELGVRYVLEGSVRRVSEKLRITVQLIETESGSHLWAEKYDRLYADIFDVQDEVVSDIAGALSLRISRAEVSRLRLVPPAKLGAWEIVQQAMVMNRQGVAASGRTTSDLESMQELRDLLKRAVELDPHYAQARAAHAWMILSTAINGWTDDPVAAIGEGRAELEAALELDTSDPLTQYYIGAAYVYYGRWDKAIRALEHSLTGNPHQPDALAHLALAQGYVGDFDLAYQTFEKADRMADDHAHSPMFIWYRAIVLGIEGRYAEAIPIIERVLEKIPRYATARITLAIAYEMTGQAEKARTAVERACEQNPGLNPEGVILNVGAHPDPEQSRQRVAVVRKYWPTA